MAGPNHLSTSSILPLIRHEEVHQADVLVGKAYANSKHDGNLALKALIQSRIDAYLKCSQKSQRTQITFDMERSVREAKGRFLERRGHDGWIQLNRSLSRRKVMETMRYAAKQCDSKKFRPGLGRQRGYTFQFNIHFDSTTSYSHVLKNVHKLHHCAAHISRPKNSDLSIDHQDEVIPQLVKSKLPARRASTPPERSPPLVLEDSFAQRRLSDGGLPTTMQATQQGTAITFDRKQSCMNILTQRGLLSSEHSGPVVDARCSLLAKDACLSGPSRSVLDDPYSFLLAAAAAASATCVATIPSTLVDSRQPALLTSATTCLATAMELAAMNQKLQEEALVRRATMAKAILAEMESNYLNQVLTAAQIERHIHH